MLTWLGEGGEWGEERGLGVFGGGRWRRRGFGVFSNFKSLEGHGPTGEDRTGHEENAQPTPSKFFYYIKAIFFSIF